MGSSRWRVGLCCLFLSLLGLCLLEDKQRFSLGEFDVSYFGHVLDPILGPFRSDFLP